MMSIFTFDASHTLGRVRAVDTRRVDVQVNSDEDLRRARVGHLVALRLPGAIEEWLIGLIDKVIKTPVQLDDTEDEAGSTSQDIELALPHESVLNTVRVTLVGTVSTDVVHKVRFSRSLVQAPEIDCTCHILREAQLQTFMNLLVVDAGSDHSLDIGRYTMDESAVAYLDGNKLFQRHASLLGSTGSGKSWAVASILERAATLPSASLIVFDLHGEYREMSYARHLRIPGPDDLGEDTDELLYLPFWLLTAEELLAMCVDQSEFTAHNQVTAFQDAVVDAKRHTLEELQRTDVLNAFTVDSPIPFSIADVVDALRELNEQMVPGARGDKQGPFYGQFARLLVRLTSRLDDRRYGFLFAAPPTQSEYSSMSVTAARLMDYTVSGANVKIIDFSEVPSEVLPVIVGLVARIVYQLQFWTARNSRHPLALVCDEAHLYLPRKDGSDPSQQRAIESFEKIAKEGRKYGVALLVVSQRPSDVSTTILCQCNNVIALRLTNADDQATVRSLMPESLEGLLDSLPVLDTGEALVVGDAVLLPSRIRITPPAEKPLSSTIQFWDEWSATAELPNFAKSVENMRMQSRG